MLVQNWMSKDVVTVDVKDSMNDAIDIIRERKINMLPVMKGNEIVGVVTDRDLKRASASEATTLDVFELAHLLRKLKLKNIMSSPAITIPINYTVEEAAMVMVDNKISGLPVIGEDGTIKGIITLTDIADLFVSLTGIRVKRGIQFAFLVEDKPGTIKALDDIFRSFGCRIRSILISYNHVELDYRKVYFRVFNLNRNRLDELKAALSEKADILYMIDHLKRIREINESCYVQ